MEKRGLATTLVCTTDTVTLVRRTGEAEGFPDLHLVAVPHPIAGNDDATIKAKADDALGEMIRVLTTSPQGQKR